MALLSCPGITPIPISIALRYSWCPSIPLDNTTDRIQPPYNPTHSYASLYNRQTKIIKDRACDEFITGIELLQMGVENVPALIGFERFFELLATKRFPVATFIRTKADIDYIQEPDIFHDAAC
ncbi:Phenylalanine-4-hydroxylase (fragment) [Moritella yayanosii]|uniref:Phenylalanine-4-hydroxylase n=1 Tax=Moritella yayanosii TaxID=69539 RepID=A0A330LUA3_9GAMM